MTTFKSILKGRRQAEQEAAKLNTESDSDSDDGDEDHEDDTAPVEDEKDREQSAEGKGDADAKTNDMEPAPAEANDEDDEEGISMNLIADVDKLHQPNTCDGWCFLNTRKTTLIQFDRSDFDLPSNVINELIDMATSAGSTDAIAKQKRLAVYLAEGKYPTSLRNCVSDLVQGMVGFAAKLLDGI